MTTSAQRHEARGQLAQVNLAEPRLQQRMRSLVAAYVVLALGTLAALVVLSAVDPGQAPSAAWIHAIIVAVFAAVLPLRLRAARSGDRGALRAVGIISAVLLLVNVVEGLLPNEFPTWMRVEMFGIGALMAGVVTLVAMVAARTQKDTHS